jgi:hypothetical protein
MVLLAQHHASAYCVLVLFSVPWGPDVYANTPEGNQDVGCVEGLPHLAVYGAPLISRKKAKSEDEYPRM